MMIQALHCFYLGFAIDCHQRLPGIPPPGVDPTMSPMAAWFQVTTAAPPGTEFIFGKFNVSNIFVDFKVPLGWGHDYGLPNFHIPMPIAPPSPSIPIVAFGAGLKLQFPASKVRKWFDMGAIHGGAADAPAVALSPGIIVAQTCQDIGGVGFVAPFGIHISPWSTEALPFDAADFLAGMLAGIGDIFLTLGGAVFGNALGKMFPKLGSVGANALMTFMGASMRTSLINYFAAGLTSIVSFGVTIVGGGAATDFVLITSTAGAILLFVGIAFNFGAGQLVESRYDGPEVTADNPSSLTPPPAAPEPPPAAPEPPPAAPEPPPSSSEPPPSSSEPPPMTPDEPPPMTPDEPPPVTPDEPPPMTPSEPPPMTSEEPPPVCEPDDE